MNEENIQQEIRIIKDAFDEKRNIIAFAPEEMTRVKKDCHPGGDIFITDGGELIDLEYQMKDFDEEELAKYVELAEELYERNRVAISIYILCPRSIQILAPECMIKSEAIFNIVLSSYGDNPAYDLFYQIKEKVDKKIKLNREDMKNLEIIPLLGPREERKKLRTECFKLLNRSLEY